MEGCEPCSGPCREKGRDRGMKMCRDMAHMVKVWETHDVVLLPRSHA